MRGEILGAERRRRWSDDEKLAIVSEVGVNGATLTKVAQRHDVTRLQIYGWRHVLKKKNLRRRDHGTLFLPVDFPAPAEMPPEPPAACSVPVELRLWNSGWRTDGGCASTARSTRLRCRG
ncbi:transposase [Mangrovicoccus sp. HB161399]|uniref:transposase n=1 Tax=Mangrovicoccus sp. HB161399 TaxID=2720392 RepID=UPI0015568546|nr:transposase [Mangrovicoccus sp. HB161399]